jgi:predicted PurR-regulated permease PerM
MSAPPTRSQCRIWWAALTGFSVAVIAALAVGIILLVGGMLSFLSPVLVPVAVAGILAYLLHPVVVWMEGRGLKRGRAILILFAVGTLVLTGIGLLVIPDLIQQGTKLFHNRAEIFERAHETIDKGLKPFGFSLEASEATTGVIDWFKSDENLAAIGGLLMNQMSGVIGMIGYFFGILLIPIYLFVFIRMLRFQSWPHFMDALIRGKHGLQRLGSIHNNPKPERKSVV